jgi:hypothetical protein
VVYVVAHLFKARTVVPEKQTLLGNGCVARSNGLTVGSGFLCGPCRGYITRGSPDTALRGPPWRVRARVRLLRAVRLVKTVTEQRPVKTNRLR